MNRLLASILIIGLGIFPVSRAAAQSPAPVDLSGQWTGNWVSNSTGHSGPLQANFTRLDDTTYQARFRGRFFVVIPFRYSVKLNVVEENAQSVTLSGSSRLGPIMGTFQYSAVADGQNFTADYNSKSDRGQFRLMKR